MPESLSGQTSWRCPACQDEVEAEKSLEIHQTPPYLILSLNRLNHGGNGGKLDDFISFPLKDLNLSTLMRKSAVAMMNEKGNTPSYECCGIVYHYGSLRGGHYTAACLNSNSEGKDEWYKYNDSAVSRVSHLDQLVTNSAYVLVYKRKGIAKQPLEKLRPRVENLDLL